MDMSVLSVTLPEENYVVQEDRHFRVAARSKGMLFYRGANLLALPVVAVLSRPDIGDAVLFFLTLGVSLAINATYLLLHFMGSRDARAWWLEVLADASVYTALAILSGGITSNFVYFYLLLIVYTATRFDRNDSLFAGATTIGLVALLSMTTEPVDEMSARLVVLILVLCTTALATGEIGQLVARMRTQILGALTGAAAANNQNLVAQRELREKEQAIRALYEVTSAWHLSFEDKLQALLAMGCERFVLSVGILSHIVGERYEVLAVRSPDAGIAKGAVFALADTYCRETLRARGPIGFEQANDSEWQTHPAYAKFKLEAYLGTPVHVGSTTYGTLNFSSLEPHRGKFTSADKDFLGLMAQWIGNDIERKWVEEQTRQRQAELAHVARLSTLGEMASGIAHELNQPLTAIASYASGCVRRLECGQDDRQALAEVLARIAAQAERAGEMILRLREFVRKGESRRSLVDVNPLIRDVVGLLGAEAKRTDVGIQLELADDLPRVWADGIQIEQVIVNLIRNGLEAISSTGNGMRRLTVQTAAYGAERVEVTVRDTGKGLSPDAIEHLFTPFYSTKLEGIGMGLSISHSIIEAHEGRLWAVSNPDGGATFQFTLPIHSGVEDEGIAIDSFGRG